MSMEKRLTNFSPENRYIKKIFMYLDRSAMLTYRKKNVRNGIRRESLEYSLAILITSLDFVYGLKVKIV